MTIEEKVYALLSGLAAYGSPAEELVPLNRIKPDGVYEGLARPYIKHFSVTVDVLHTHEGMAELKRWPYQVSIFADSVASLTAVRTAVMAILDGSRDPRFFLTGLVNLQPLESTDTPVIGQALLLDAWYE